MQHIERLMGAIPLDLCRVSRQSRGHVDYSFGSLMGQASRLIAFASAAIVLGILGQPVLADGARQQADKRDVKKQEFLKRLPLESRCKAEVTGGVVKPEGERNWKSGAFEVEPEDDFRVTILRLDQLAPPEQEVCDAQARSLFHDDVQRTGYFEDGTLICLRRVFNDRRRLAQLTACNLVTLLTQPTHLRCKNLDPLLDPDGIYISPNLVTALTLGQAVMTKGSCQAADRY